MTNDSHRNALLHYLRTTAARMHTELIVYRANQEPVKLGAWNEDSTWIKAARILYHENERSICARYKDAKRFAFEESSYANPLVRPITPVEAIKACDCYDYQACETRDYRDTLARALVDMVRSAAVTSLPGYEQAKWGCDDSRFAA